MRKTLLTIGIVLVLCAVLVAATACGGEPVGIASIEKTGSEGLVDTYTITLTNGETSTFTVTNGEKGKDGVNADGTSADPNAPTPDRYFRFNLLEDGTYEVSARFVDMPSRVVIPASYNGKAITKIADGAFFVHFTDEYSPASIDEIVLPDTITIIGRSAFEGQSYLRSINIPSSVTSIERGAFYGCSSLTSVTIPDGVTNIGSYAFFRCTGLTSVTIPASVTSINYGAFCRCTGLTSVTIGNGVTSIGWGAFYCCTGLTTITFNGTVAQWNSIEKSSGWDSYMGNYTIQCTDDNIAKSI